MDVHTLRGLVIALIFASIAAAQTTESSNGLALSDREIANRMAELNRRAATQPSDASALSQAARVDIARAASGASAAALAHGRAQAAAMNAQATAHLTAIDRQLAVIAAAAQPILAEQASLQQKEQAEIDAASVDYTQGDFIGQIGDDSANGSFTGTTTNNTAVELVKSRYDPKLADVQSRLDAIARQGTPLFAQRSQWQAVTRQAAARLQQANIDARRAADAAITAETAHQRQQLAAPATTPANSH